MDKLRLRLFVRLDLASVAAATVLLVLIRTGSVRSDWIEVILAVLLVQAAALIRADALVTRGRYLPAALLVTVANWFTIVTATALVPFTVDTHPLIVLLLTLLTVPYLDRARLAALGGATIVVALAVALLGRLGRGVGLEASTPTWILDWIVFLFLPVEVGLLAFLAWHNHLVMSAQMQHLRQAQGRLVAAIAGERQRIERSLRDGTQRRLATARERLGGIQRLVTEHPQRVEQLLDELITEVQDANAELRELTHGIFPPELAEHGLETAVRTAARHSPVPATVRATGLRRYPPEVETTVYFCCVRGLRYAEAPPAVPITIELTDADGALSFRLWPTRHGRDLPSHTTPETDAYQGLGDRVAAVGGTLRFGHRPALYGRIPHATRREEPDARRDRPGAAADTALARLWYHLGERWCQLGPQNLAGQSALVGIRALLTATAGSLALVAVASVVAPHPAMLMLAALTALAWGLLRYALWLARRGREQVALLATAAIFWTYPLAVTVMIPVTGPFTPIVLVIPAILAAPYQSRRRFRMTLAATIAAGAAVAVASRLLPGAGIQERAPEWFADPAVVALTVVTTTLALFFVWMNHGDLAARAQALNESQRNLVTTTDRERRRIERNLHDGAQQRLIAVAVDLRVIQRLMSSRPDQVGAALDNLARQLDEASDELRDLTYDIFPPELLDGGLASALQAAVARSPTPATVHATALRRHPPEVELSIYFCCLEALQNAVKHAGTTARVTISLADRDGLTFDVRDTGPGCDPGILRAGHGTANMHDRLDAVGGTLTINTSPGAGVHLHGHVPVSSGSTFSAG